MSESSWQILHSTSNIEQGTPINDFRRISSHKLTSKINIRYPFDFAQDRRCSIFNFLVLYDKFFTTNLISFLYNFDNIKPCHKFSRIEYFYSLGVHADGIGAYFPTELVVDVHYCIPLGKQQFVFRLNILIGRVGRNTDCILLSDQRFQGRFGLAMS